MKQHTFEFSVGIIFLVIAVVHLARVMQGWSASIGGWSVPFWFSYVAILVAGYFSFHAFKLSGKIR